MVINVVKIYPSLLFLYVHSVLWCCWLGGRKGIRPAKKLSGGLPAWLSVWSKKQTCIWPCWCHCHSLSLALVVPWFSVCVCVCCTVYNCTLNSSLMVVSVVEIYASLVFLYQLVIVGCWSCFDFVHTFVPYALWQTTSACYGLWDVMTGAVTNE